MKCQSEPPRPSLLFFPAPEKGEKRTKKMPTLNLFDAMGCLFFQDLDSGFNDKPSSHLIPMESELSMKEEIGAGAGAH